jgi:hypothetical protein
LLWAKPFLPLVGLSDTLLNHVDVWEAIYTSVFSEYQVQGQSKDWVSIQYEGLGELRHRTVVNMLCQVANQLGLEAATDLEQWVWFHFFCHEAEIAMDEWWSALNCLYIPADSRQFSKKVEPPTCLQPLLPQIYEFINYDHYREIDQAIEEAAPPPAYEQSPYTKLDKCYESVLLSKCVGQALIAQALQTIAKNFNELERLEVARWAEIQIRTRHPKYGHPEKLCGDKYLKPKLVCVEAPSLLGGAARSPLA